MAFGDMFIVQEAPEKWSNVDEKFQHEHTMGHGWAILTRFINSLTIHKCKTDSAQGSTARTKWRENWRPVRKFPGSSSAKDAKKVCSQNSQRFWLWKVLDGGDDQGGGAAVHG